VEALLTAKYNDDLFKNPGPDHIDLNTLVTLLISSNIPNTGDDVTKNQSSPNPNLLSPHSTCTNESPHVKQVEYTIDSLIESFLNQKFTSTRLLSPGLTNKLSVPKVNQIIEEVPSSSISSKDMELNLKSCLPIGYLTRPIKELFCHYMKKYFHLYNGIKIFFDECDTSIVGLNKFRQGSLQELFKQKSVKLDLLAEHVLEFKDK